MSEGLPLALIVAMLVIDAGLTALVYFATREPEVVSDAEPMLVEGPR